MNKNKNARIFAFACAVLILLSFALTAFAEGGNGDGTGGGKDKPLELAESSIANGSKNVSTTPEIKLTFTKNVVNFTVRDNNMKCFSLTDSKGNSVPIDIIMGDDQVEPTQEVKRTVTVKPKSPLTPGETYVLKIDKNVTSKSGVSIGKDTYISFTVAKSETASTSKPASTIPATTSAGSTSTTRSGSNPGGVVTTVTGNRLSTIAATSAAETERTSRASRTTTTAAPKTTKAAKTTAAEKSTTKSVATTVKTTAAKTTEKTETVKKTTAATSAGVTILTTVQTYAETITAETMTAVTEYSEETYESQSDYTETESEEETENLFISPAGRPEDETEAPAEKTDRSKYTPFIIGAAAVAVLLAGAAIVFLSKKSIKK